MEKLLTQLLTQEDVAQIFNVDKKTVENWRKEGKLQPCAGIPVIRFDPDYIRTLLDIKKDRMSPIERMKLQNRIEELEYEKSKLISMLSGMFANYPEFIRIMQDR